MDKPVYDFIPYHYGCYSFQANQDLSTLTKYNIVANSEHRWAVLGKTDYLKQVISQDKSLLLKFHCEFHKLKGDDLIRYVYESNPYYAINSRIAESILSAEKYEKVLNTKPKQNEYRLFTIGYEGKSVEYYTNQLIKENVKVLCDIRKNPISMKYGFSKNQLKYIIENIGIKYYHLPELGIESSKRQSLTTQEDYDALFREYEENTLPQKVISIEKINDILLHEKRIALTCFEANYECCHRSRTAEVISNKFHKDNLIKHI